MNKATRPRSPPRRLMKSRAVPVGCGLLFLFLLKFVFFFGYVPTASMEPAIREGSFVFGVRACGELKRGDVVVFEHEGLLLVKRIAGVPGDAVYGAGGRALTVPEGCYYVLGDNPEDSADSRQWSDPFVPAGRIIAKLWSAR